MKEVTAVYVVGGVACIGMLVLMVNVVFPSNNHNPDKALVTQVLYEPDNFNQTDKPHFDKIILIISSSVDGSHESDKQSRESTRNTWIRTISHREGGDEMYGVFFVCIASDDGSESFDILLQEAVTYRDMTILQTPSDSQLSIPMVAVDWARNKFRYNVMLIVDDKVMVNVRELDHQIDVVMKYNITGAGPLSKAQNIHIWSSGATIAFNKEANKHNKLDTPDQNNMRALIANNGIVTTRLEGFHDSWGGYCKGSGAPWILIQSLDPLEMNRLWQYVKNDKDICSKEGEPKP